MENGNHVTRAELKAHLDPMRADIREIKEIVTGLRDKEVGDAAVAVSAKDNGARRVALVAVAASFLSALWWVPEAIAKVTS